MKCGITWILCLLMVAGCGQTHAKPDLLEQLRTTDNSIGPSVVNDLYLMGDDRLPFLIQTLRDENQYARQKALYLLANYYADPNALSALTTTFLHDTDDQIRGSAAWIIASIDTEYAKKLMVKHLNSDVKTQEIVVELLSELKDERVIPKLIERLEDPKASPEIRRSAAYALADFKDKRALPVLLDMLDTPESQNSALIKSIIHIGDEQTIPELLNLYDSVIGWDEAHELSQFGVAIVPPLLEILAQTEPRDIESMNVRSRIFHILRNIPTLESASFFESVCLETNDPELQSVMVAILENMGTEGLVCLLNIAQQKPNPTVLGALTTYNRTVAVDAIAAHALDESSLFRVEAIQSLAYFGGLWKAAVSKHISRLLADPSSNVKLVTIDLIRQLRLTEAIPALKQLTQDPDENIRNAARLILDILSGQPDWKLEIETDQQQYDYGQPITLTYRLTNVNKYPIKIAIAPRLIEKLGIQQPDGTSARHHGMHADYFFPPELEYYKTLHPGDELTDTISISQHTHWLHQQGKYTVNLHIVPWDSGIRHGFLAWPYTITSKVDFNIAPPTTKQLDAILARIDAGDITDTGKTYHQLCELNKSGLFPVLKTRALIPLDSISNSEPTSMAQWLGEYFLTLSNTELVPKCIEMLPSEAMVEILGALGDTRAIEPLRQSAIGGSMVAALTLQELGDDSIVKWCTELARRKLRHWRKEERVKGAEMLRILQQRPSNIKRWSWVHRNALTVRGFYDRNDSPALASDWAEIIEKAGTLEGLKELLEHAIPVVRSAAAYELAYLGNISGVHLIQQDLDANDTETRWHAQETLLKLQRQ